MNFTNLKYFYDASTTLSMTAAGRLNRVGVSAISQGIRNLENSLGLKLLEHKRREVVLTPGGRVLLEEARSLLDKIAGIEEKIKNTQSSPKLPPIKGAISASIMSGLLKDSIVRTLRSHSGQAWSIQVGATHQVAQYVASRESDFGICLDDGTLSSFKKRKIATGSFILVGNDSQKKENYLVTSLRPEVVDLERTLQRNGKTFSLKVVDSWTLIADLSEQGLGFGLIPDFVLKNRQKIKVANAIAIESKYTVVAIALSVRALESPVISDIITGIRSG
jgi:DNA-binding transcriptional LysR family regulator